MPSKEAQARLERRSGGTTGDSEDNALQGRREVLKDAQERVEWEKWETSRRQELEDAQEAERIAFAEIDWQDFVVVSTVEFTEGDEAGLVELPPPMSISEVENMTIAQKKMAAMIMEGREDEIAEDEKRRADAEDAEMELDDDDEAQPVTAETELEKERQRVTEIRAAESSGTRKIRKDYVPKCACISSLLCPLGQSTHSSMFPQPSGLSLLLLSLPPLEINKSLLMSLQSTFESNSWIRDGRKPSVKAKPTVPLRTFCQEVSFRT